MRSFTIDVTQTASGLTRVTSSFGDPITFETLIPRGADAMVISTRAYCYRGGPNRGGILFEDAEVKARAWRLVRS